MMVRRDSVLLDINNPGLIFQQDGNNFYTTIYNGIAGLELGRRLEKQNTMCSSGENSLQTYFHQLVTHIRPPLSGGISINKHNILHYTFISTCPFLVRRPLVFLENDQLF